MADKIQPKTLSDLIEESAALVRNQRQEVDTGDPRNLEEAIREVLARFSYAVGGCCSTRAGMRVCAGDWGCRALVAVVAPLATFLSKEEAGRSMLKKVGRKRRGAETQRSVSANG